MFVRILLAFNIISFNNIYATVTVCSTDACPDLTTLHGIKCNKFENNIDCLMSISKNETQLGFALPYQAIAANQFISNLEIIGEVTKTEESPEWDFEIVVVTNRDVSNFTQLKNFNYYNWGFGDLRIPNFVMNEFEAALYEMDKSQNCRGKTTLAEKQVCVLNNFFGPSCRKGFWTNVADQDRVFKRNYIKLCQSCTFNFICTMVLPVGWQLNSNESSIVVTRLKEVKLLRNVHYLCPNGTASHTPCAWYQQPHPLIYTRKGLKQDITPKLKQLFSICSNKPEDCKGIFGNTFSLPTPYLSVLNENKSKSIVPVLENNNPYSEVPLKWCTTSDLETEKCEWLKFFSAHLVYPIDCVQRASKSECVEAIKNYEADLVEITNIPIKNNLIPIAISKTINQLIDLSTFPNSDCVDKYSITNVLVESGLIFKHKEDCPNGVYRVLCSETNCTYLTEIIMRKDDPNKDNAQTLITNLMSNFIEANETRPFDLFGKFKGVPDLLFKGNSSFQIVEVSYEEVIVPYRPYIPEFETKNTPTSKTGIGQWIFYVFLAAIALTLRYIIIYAGRRACNSLCRRETVLVRNEDTQNGVNNLNYN